MAGCGRSWAQRILLTALVLALGDTGLGEDTGSSLASPSYRVLIRSSAVAERVRRAVRGAAQRLAQSECQQVLSDFHSPDGMALRDRVAAFEVPPEGYLALVVFADGSADRACLNRRVLAFTSPGSRVVRICPSFPLEHARDAGVAEANVIHEMLHTLGLGENPPSTHEINARIYARCGR
jgi:hypothetical protein